ncbi:MULTISPECIES: hypothetical protein [Mumia]|uniref:hypothetical protein n=1 Tax=Mumia TaxID=1546255 RepID=UPI00141E3478|nr:MULTISPECIES: hypothetical protein [unclassified Mumia]QMW65366.1 hypothetical protein H4N58_14300 [Mumia sp. ZJ1417]
MGRNKDDAVSVEDAAATYEKRSRRADRVRWLVVATGSILLAAVVAIGIAGLEPLG